MKPFYESRQLRFSCTRCGRCCETASEYFVFLRKPEAERIREHLQLSPAWFRRRYLRHLEDGDLVLAAGRNEHCIFLDRQGQCRIYPVRPVQCRTYPFWPEVVNSRQNWLREATRCEGINSGEIVSVKKIRQALKACAEQSA